MSFATLSFSYISSVLRAAGLVESVFEFDDRKVQCYVGYTDKPPVVLIHGFGVSGEFQWFKMVRQLSQTHRVILINLLRFGKSVHAVPEQCTISDQVETVRRVLQHLEIEQAVIAGLSYGGLIASEFAEMHPAMTAELVLINSPTKYLDLEALESFLKSHGVTSVEEFFVPSKSEGLRKQMALANYRAPWLPGWVYTSYFKAFCQPYLSGWTAIVNELVSSYDVLKGREYVYSGSVKLIWGENDRLIPLSVGVALERHYANAQLFIIQKCGHLATIERAGEVTRIIAG
jgi:pimeloyl-ACP methyl ester carboxylesterase